MGYDSKTIRFLDSSKLSLLSPLKDCVSTNKIFHNGLAWQLVLFIYRAGAMCCLQRIVLRLADAMSL